MHFIPWISGKLKDIASSDSSGTDSFDGTSVARVNYIKFRILTRGTAGSSYYSNYKETSAIRRNSKPNPPTEIKTSLRVRRIPYYFLEWS